MIKKMAYGGKVKKMMDGGMAMKDVPMDKKKSLGKLPTEVRNKMGFKKAGGKVKMKDGGTPRDRLKPAQRAPKYRDLLMRGEPKPIRRPKLPKMGDKPKATPMGDKPKGKKMMGGGMAMKYKHGGMTKKCPRDGIAIKGKTRA